MKKILALILALVMLFALAACGQQPAAQEPTEARLPSSPRNSPPSSRRKRSPPPTPSP